MQQVESSEVPADVLGDLQSVSDAVSMVDSWHEDLRDKENLHQQEHGPVYHGHHDIKREWSVHAMVRVVMAKRVSSNKIPKGVEGGK